ncbi:hypothetical protein BKA83DRAFT_4133990 [Pisolithus microcarpus]|nr:hypothetical protein BKA83DRAFT_4133990 [Pisolithus microcarpus]
MSQADKPHSSTFNLHARVTYGWIISTLTGKYEIPVLFNPLLKFRARGQSMSQCQYKGETVVSPSCPVRPYHGLSPTHVAVILESNLADLRGFVSQRIRNPAIVFKMNFWHRRCGLGGYCRMVLGSVESTSIVVVPLRPGYLNTVGGHNEDATSVDKSIVNLPFTTAVGERISVDERVILTIGILARHVLLGSLSWNHVRNILPQNKPINAFFFTHLHSTIPIIGCLMTGLTADVKALVLHAQQETAN